MSVCRLLLLQRKHKLGRTKRSTGPRVGHSWPTPLFTEGPSKQKEALLFPRACTYFDQLLRSVQRRICNSHAKYETHSFEMKKHNGMTRSNCGTTAFLMKQIPASTRLLIHLATKCGVRSKYIWPGPLSHKSNRWVIEFDSPADVSLLSSEFSFFLHKR